jgi:VanZ family protein
VPQGPPGLPGIDKAVHIFLYAILGALATRASLTEAVPARSLLRTLAWVAAFGGVDELHQRFIPGRSADVVDWFADVAGGAIGITLVAATARRISAQ